MGSELIDTGEERAERRRIEKQIADKKRELEQILAHIEKVKRDNDLRVSSIEDLDAFTAMYDVWVDVPIRDETWEELRKLACSLFELDMRADG